MMDLRAVSTLHNILLIISFPTSHAVKLVIPPVVEFCPAASRPEGSMAFKTLKDGHRSKRGSLYVYIIRNVRIKCESVVEKYRR
jgi:hypothetical protein